MKLRLASAVIVAALASSCGGPVPAPEAALCDNTGMQAMHASAEGRWVLGQASRYPADTALGARADELHRSQRARRAVAWEAVARTLAPVALAQPTGVAGATVPRFRTWYDREDTSRVFSQLYGNLGAAGRAAQARFTDGALDDAFGWNAGFAATLPEWPSDRLRGYAAGLDTGASVAGLSGLQRIAMSPDAVRHLVQSYPEIVRCITAGAPPSFEDSAQTSQLVAHEPVALTACGTHTAGPFFVASGGSLQARIDGAPVGTEVHVLAGVGPAATERCVAAATAGCTIAGPGVFTVRVTTQSRSASGMLDVRYTAPTPAIAGCLNGVFPPAAATVALEWRRTDIGLTFPTYDTSAAALTRRLAPGADATWGAGDGSAEPGEDRAYTLRLAEGSTFRLAAMHIRTRELDHWLNITLWWSPTPDEDFGADRPASVRALGGPWSSYKMCVATDFDEQDPEPTGGFDQDAPTLAAALRVVHEGRGGPSWCSNPYIDAGPGLVRSNCVGCHQHAMSGVRPGEVQNDLARYPGNGRMQVRNNYPSDGFWGLDAGDQLGAAFNETVDYWRTAP